MCHMSRVRCHLSGVMFQVDFFLNLQSGGASRWRICYQWGLLRLVYSVSTYGFRGKFWKYTKIYIPY